MSPRVYEIATTTSFWQSVEQLDGRHRKAVHESLVKLADGNAGAHVHKLEGAPFVSFGVSTDALRVICAREDATLIALYVDLHKPAYEWARRHKIAQVGRHLRLVRSDVTDATPETPLEVALPGSLSSVPDDVFASIDMSPRVAALLRSLDDEALYDLSAQFVPAKSDALLELATSPDEHDAIAARYHDAITKTGPAPSLAAAVRDEANAGMLWLFSPDDDAVKRALDGDFAAWRVFLHPSQRRIVAMDSRGALKIGGGPGTGKTIVALHRARHLAERIFASDERPVLMTTFGNVLAKQLGAALDELCGAASDVRARIRVESLTRVAQEVLRAADRPRTFIPEVEEIWKDALALDTAGRGRAFYESEREQVLARNDVWTEEAYVKAARTGRRTALDRVGRREVFAVLAAFEAGLAKAGGGDVLALAREATTLLTSGAVPAPWSAVVCDEVQDAGATELRLLAALTRESTPREDGRYAIRANALTIAGDGLQRIYRVPVALSSCGIDTRGRSRTLRLNYRTTEAIRQAAVRVLADAPTGEMLDEADQTSLEGYRSLRGGVAPVERTFTTPAGEAEWIGELARDAMPGPILVLARTNQWLQSLKTLLESRAITPRVLGADQLLAPTDRVVLCTLQRAKGLEAPRVVLAGRQLIPAKYPGGDPADRAEWERKERCLLYVGMTRARDWCGVATVEV